MSDVVFISGSIKIKSLPEEFLISINNIIRKKMKIVIGDAPGVDTKVQEYLHNMKYSNVQIYHIGLYPRNNVGGFSTKKITYWDLEEFINLPDDDKNKIEKSERLKQTFKDKQMELDADHLLVLWDGKSKGSKNNIINGLKNSKYVKVFYNKLLTKEEVTIEHINRIFLSNNGLSITEVKIEIEKVLWNKNKLSKSDILKYNIDKYYPLTIRKVEENIEELKDFVIVKMYKGNKQYSFKYEIIDFLVTDSLKKIDEFKKNETMSLFK